MLINIFWGLLGLGLLVVIHEWGHFFAARKLGVEVTAFSIGWGPVLWSKLINGTEYRLSAIPLGGYCKMKGSDSLQSAIENSGKSIPHEEGSFYSAAWWKRILILFSGPFVNTLTAVLFFWLVYSIGFSYQTYPNRIVVDPQPDSPAVTAGLATGDRIIEIQGTPVLTFEDIRREIGSSGGRELNITLERDNRTISTVIKPLINPETGAGRIGIYPFISPVVADLRDSSLEGFLMPGDQIREINGQAILHALDAIAALESLNDQQSWSMKIERNNQDILIENGRALSPDTIVWETLTYSSPGGNPVSHLKHAVQETAETFHLAAQGIAVLFRGVQITQAVSGPVQITHMVGEVATRGFSLGFRTGIVSILQFLGLISIILAFMNLLPIPALDGGQILLALIDRMWPRPLSPIFISRYMNIGAILVLLLIAVAVTSDILFLFRG
ncbi:RIP metalloprotease RseP [Spirochaeta dissipatitropha]